MSARSADWSAGALAFFRSRAISPEIAVECGVTEHNGALHYPNVSEDGTPFCRERPLRGRGTRQPRGVPLMPWWPGGTSPRSVAAIVTEGESDALAALTAIRVSRSRAIKGIAVVSVPGTGFGADKLAKHLVACGIETAWLAFDADDAGRAANENAARALAHRHIRARVLRLPQGMDLAECLAKSDDPARWLESALFLTKRGEDEGEESRESELLRMAGAMKRVGFHPVSIAAALEVENDARQPVLDEATMARLTRAVRGWNDAPPWLSDPVEFILDDRLHADERLLLLFLIQRLRADGSRRIGTRTLARQLRWRLARVLAAKRGLVAHGRIEWTAAGGFRSGLFRVLAWTASEDSSSCVPPVGTELPNSHRGISPGSTLIDQRSSVPPVGTLEAAR
jgi:hypothetical protein